MTDAATWRFPAGRLLIFARAPEAGAVKTRLAAGVGAEAAAGLYRELVRNTLEMAVGARLAAVELHVTPDTTHPFFASLVKGGAVSLKRQRGKDLGERMYLSLRGALKDSEFALLIGTDCPVMTADYLARACSALQGGKELVLGPVEDGGYALIGCRQCWPKLFQSMPWGGDRVLQLTRERAQALRLRYAELDVLWDLDTPADLERWRALYQTAPAGAPPTTV
jgi:rSAM/selenodomain-associated transferase 1